MTQYTPGLGRASLANAGPARASTRSTDVGVTPSPDTAEDEEIIRARRLCDLGGRYRRLRRVQRGIRSHVPVIGHSSRCLTAPRRFPAGRGGSSGPLPPRASGVSGCLSRNFHGHHSSMEEPDTTAPGPGVPVPVPEPPGPDLIPEPGPQPDPQPPDVQPSPDPQIPPDPRPPELPPQDPPSRSDGWSATDISSLASKDGARTRV